MNKACSVRNAEQFVRYLNATQQVFTLAHCRNDINVVGWFGLIFLSDSISLSLYQTQGKWSVFCLADDLAGLFDYNYLLLFSFYKFYFYFHLFIYLLLIFFLLFVIVCYPKSTVTLLQNTIAYT